MENRQQQAEHFFDRYAARVNAALQEETRDIEETVQSFAECFVEASPVGVQCGKNDEQFRAVIPQGYGFYKSIGITAMNILSKETTLLDDLHAMVKVHWESVYVKQDGAGGSIEFDVIYFLQSKDNQHRIFAYITGDEQKALKEHGLTE